MDLFDCLVIGAGPGGISAAIELKNAGKNVAIIEKSTPGGKVNIAPRVDNYPGFTKIPGPELAYEFFKRLKASGVSLIADEVLGVKKEGEYFVLSCNRNTFKARTILVASGTNERKLGLPNEDRLFGHGLSYCAVCDGHFFKDKDVIVIGGGNSALKEAIYLAPIVKHLTLIHRRNEFRGLNKLVDELKEFHNTEVLTPYVPLEFLGDEKVTGIVIQNKETEENKTLQVDGIFPLVGQIPNSQFLNFEGVKNESGNIIVDKDFMTIIPGLFAVGDVLPRDIRQIYLSEFDGKRASKSIINYLG